MSVPIIIIGSVHHNTLSLIRDYGRRGLAVIAIIYGQEGKNFVTSSRFISCLYNELDEASAIGRLKVILAEMSTPPVILTGSDGISSMMDQCYPEFVSRCKFFNAGEKGRISENMDKQRQLQLASLCGFSVPWSLETDYAGMVDLKVSFPCIVKPKESYKSGKKIAICKSQKDFEQARSLFTDEESILVQDYLEKEDEVVILGMTINLESTIPGFVVKHRDYKGGTTYSTTHPSSELPGDVISSCEQMLKSIAYQGLWGIECIRCGGRYYFIELNLRNDATSFSLTEAGYDLLYLYYMRVIGEDYCETGTVKQIDSMVEFEDFNFVLKREISFLKWLKQHRGCKCRYYYDRTDMQPFIQKLKSNILFLQRRVFKY